MQCIEDLPEVVKNRPLYKVTLPGTHNSGVYRVDLSVKLASDGFGWWAEKFRWITAGFVSRWTVCQSLDIAGQLNLGIRAFDLRYSYAEKEDDFWLSHTFASVRILPQLQAIRRFLDTHPKEIVYMRIKPDHANRSNLTDALKHRMAEMCLAVFGEHLYPAQKNLTMSINDMLLRDQRAIVNFEPRQNSDALFQFYERRVRSWPDNIAEKTELLDDVAERASQLKHSVLEFTLTPSDAMIKKDIYNPCRSGSLRDLAEMVDTQFDEWMKRYADTKRIFQITMDFPRADHVVAIYTRNSLR